MSASSRMTVATHALTWMALVCPKRPDGIVTSDQIAASVNTNPVVIRRTARMLPRELPVPEEGVTVSRNVLGSRAAVKPQTTRSRRIAGELPDWEPLPPGELIVRRPAP